MNAKFSTNFPLHPSILAFIDDSNCRKINQNVSMYNYHRNVLIKFKQMQFKSVKNVSKIESRTLVTNSDFDKRHVRNLKNATYDLERGIDRDPKKKFNTSCKIPNRNFVLENKMNVRKTNSKVLKTGCPTSLNLTKNKSHYLKSSHSDKMVQTSNSTFNSRREIYAKHKNITKKQSNQKASQLLKNSPNNVPVNFITQIDRKKTSKKYVSQIRNQDSARKPAKRNLVKENLDGESRNLSKNKYNTRIKELEFNFADNSQKNVKKIISKSKISKSSEMKFLSQLASDMNDLNKSYLSISRENYPVNKSESSISEIISSNSQIQGYEGVSQYLFNEVFSKIYYSKERQNFHKIRTENIICNPLNHSNTKTFRKKLKTHVTSLKRGTNEVNSNRENALETNYLNKKSFPLNKIHKRDNILKNKEKSNESHNERILEFEKDNFKTTNNKHSKNEVNLLDFKKYILRIFIKTVGV
jgi:hypothetical protein